MAIVIRISTEDMYQPDGTPKSEGQTEETDKKTDAQYENCPGSDREIVCMDCPYWDIATPAGEFTGWCCKERKK